MISIFGITTYLKRKPKKEISFLSHPAGNSPDCIKRVQCSHNAPSGGGVICESCNVQQLYKDEAEVTEEEVNDAADINMLKINPLMWTFLHGLNESIKSGLNCRGYFDNKIKEMLIILKASYPRKELQSFFYLILSPNMAFMEYVRGNNGKYNSVAEFAQARA